MEHSQAVRQWVFERLAMISVDVVQIKVNLTTYDLNNLALHLHVVCLVSS